MTKSKYRAKPKYIDGIYFRSTKEANRYVELKLLEKAGEISQLKTQPKYVIILHMIKICTYTADFLYWDEKKAQYMIEDVKGMKKGAAYNMFKLKSKLMKAVHNIDVLET